MSVHNKNAPKTVKKRRRVPFLSPGARIQLRIGRLRKLAVGGRHNIKYFQGEKGSQTISARIWNEFLRTEAYNSLKTIRHGQCVEDEILSAMSRLGPLSAEALEQARKSALLQARAVLFDHFISESLVIKGWGKMLNMRHAYLAARLLHDPYCVTTDVLIASALAEGIDRHKVDFLRGLAEVQYNLSRRSKRVSDDCLFMLATNWTNPHCPLWLMTRGAIRMACLGLSINLVATEAMIEERLKSLKLVRAASPPIVGVECNLDGRIEKFVVSKFIFDLIKTREFTNSHDRKYCLVKRPSRHRSYSRAEK
ncbi:MAG: hypothetical protein J0L73_25925 [Verrucomicrobia bacterium]|nr:hypothetical protein [Verrucomicrobiota bacterium]